MEKSIVLCLVLMIVNVKDSDGAEESEVYMENSWNLDTLSPGRAMFIIYVIK